MAGSLHVTTGICGSEYFRKHSYFGFACHSAGMHLNGYAGSADNKSHQAKQDNRFL